MYRGESWALLSVLTVLANSKRGRSKFHTIDLWISGLIVHCYMLPNVKFWWEPDMRAAKGKCEPGLRVWPYGCQSPPTAQRGGFYPDLCDGSIHAPVKSPVKSACCLTPQEYDEADDDDEARN